LVNLPFVTSDWRRLLPQEVQLPLLNRYLEEDPTNIDGPTSLLARPGLKRWLNIGSGPIRGMYSQYGSFNDALFIVSGAGLYRVDKDETVTLLSASINGTPYNYVSMVATDTHLFVADGTTLWGYTDNGRSQGTLTSTGAITSGEQVRIGDIYYQFTSGSVDAGAPLGTSGAPWLVLLGASVPISLDNLAAAIEGSGTAGTDYSTALNPHTEVNVNSVSGTTLSIRALTPGVAGDSIVTTETGVNLAWTAGTLGEGGDTDFFQVDMPDTVGAIWVDVIASHVIVVVAEGNDMNGRFYWIEPAETEIDALNFATAERGPDPLYAAITFGDQFWLFGSGTTEPWYPTGNGDAPFMRVQGRVFDHGIWEGTPVKYKSAMLVVDRDGVVWDISGQVERISDHSIEQNIREAMAEQLKNI
jgi:hypothetical protein